MDLTVKIPETVNKKKNVHYWRIKNRWYWWYQAAFRVMNRREISTSKRFWELYSDDTDILIWQLAGPNPVDYMSVSIACFAQGTLINFIRDHKGVINKSTLDDLYNMFRNQLPDKQFEKKARDSLMKI